MPVSHLRKLLSEISKSEDEVDQSVVVQRTEPVQRRVQMLQSASAPRLSRRVIDLVSTKADQDGDGWILYQVILSLISQLHKATFNHYFGDLGL